jgi:hypothetical protein
MSGSQTSQQLAQEALEEHKTIHFYLDQVCQTLDGLRLDLSDVEPMRRLAAQIEGLKERLQEHHQLEERGGLFRSILDALPEARVEISRLIKDHEKMIEILEMARIHAQCGEAAEADALRVDLERFLGMFREHEQAEEHLLERAMAREGRAIDID